MSTAAFSSPDKAVLGRSVDSTRHDPVPEEQIGEVYEIERSVQWIQSGKFTVVALQFPDELMCDSTSVVRKLARETTATVIILGDTSYGSCCVDEIAAQHYNADCIIHYGRACLSPTRRLPVLYVFGRLTLDISDCVEKFGDLYPDTESKVCILYDTVYSHAIGLLTDFVIQRYRNIVVSRLAVDCSDMRCSAKPNNKSCSWGDSPMSEMTSDCVPVSQKETDCAESNPSSKNQICSSGRLLTLPHDGNIDDYEMFYIGKEGPTLTNFMMTFNKCKFCSYDPESKAARKESLNVNKALMKRYYMIERAKDARIVGIVVGTLGVAEYLTMINRLQSLIKAAGKKSYTFVVGKLNVPKLANFMEVDVFVLVACPENTLLDSSEFYKPVVTPYEMELACNPGREWTGEYITDFRSLLPGREKYVELSTESSEENIDVSLISGKMRTLGQTDTPEMTSSAVILRNEALAVATVPADSAGEFLAGRSWRGLEQKLGDSPVSKAVEGRSGIAAGYSHEPSEENKTEIK